MWDRGLKVTHSPRLSGWLLGQGSGGAWESGSSVIRGMSQLGRGEAVLSPPPLGSARLLLLSCLGWKGNGGRWDNASDVTLTLLSSLLGGIAGCVLHQHAQTLHLDSTAFIKIFTSADGG